MAASAQPPPPTLHILELLPAVKLVDAIFTDNELPPCFRLSNLATEISRALFVRLY